MRRVLPPLKRWPAVAALCLLVACGGDAALPSGLDCIAVAESVDSYQAAYDYFLAERSPALLDPDGNGVPCEEDFAPREIADVIETSTTTSATTTTTTTGTTTTIDDTTTTTATATTTSSPGTTSTTTAGTTTSTIDESAPVGQFASAVGGTTPRVCQRWEEELFDQDSEILDAPFFGFLRETPSVGAGTIAVFCVFGFDFGEDSPIQVEVTAPNQQTTTFSVVLDSLEDQNTAADPLAGEDLSGDGDVEGVQWVVASGHELGVYQFVATQGELTSDASVEIVPAASARIDPFVEDRGGFPSPIGFAFSGFPAGASIQLGIYKDVTEPFVDNAAPSDHQFELTASVDSVTADQAGAVVVQLEDGEFEYVSGHRYCLATTLDLIENPVCDNFRGGWFTP